MTTIFGARPNFQLQGSEIMFEAMYYPYASIKNEETLKQSMLYLDRIHVLTPVNGGVKIPIYGDLKFPTHIYNYSSRFLHNFQNILSLLHIYQPMLPTFLRPVTFALDIDGRTMMQCSIQNRCSNNIIVEYLPIRLIGSKNH